MNRAAFHELAELWQEQVDPGQRATLHALAHEIKTRARRQRLIDFGISAFAAALILGLLTFPMATFLKAILGLCLLGAIWGGWKSNKIAASVLAMDAGDPASFLTNAVENARAELNFYKAGLYASAFVFAVWLVLILTDQGLEGLDFVPNELLGFRYVKVTVLAVAVTLFFAWFIRATRQLGDCLRRLEAMKRECDEEDWRDLTEA